MSGNINLQDLTAGDIAKGNATQLMVCLLLDTSYSMLVNGGIDELNKGVETFINQSKESFIARDALDLCIITFGNEKAQVFQEFKNIEYVNFTPLKASGQTYFIDGLKLALDRIDGRRRQWTNTGISFFHPLLIIMSDGKENEISRDNDAIIEKLQSYYKKHLLNCKCIGIGNDVAINELQKFCQPNEKIEKMNSIDIYNYFADLSKSVTEKSAQSIYDEQ